MGNIAVSKFRLGSTPPSITVLDVTDPLEEWYVHMDQEEARLAQEAADAGGGESMDEDDLASGEDDDDGRFADEYTYSPDGSIVMVGEGDDMEYLENAPFEEEERIETESWLRRQQRRELNGSTDTSSDSFKDEIQKVFMARGLSGPGSAASKATSSRGRTAVDAGEGSDVEASHQTESTHHHFKSAMASPTKTSPSSTTSSSSSASSGGRPYRTSSPVPKMNLQEKARPSLLVTQPKLPESTKRQNRKPHLDIDTKTASPRAFSTLPSPYNAFLGRPTVSKSLSSHASDDDIESEAFYTQGESTIYKQLKNLALESATLHTLNSALSEKVPLETALSPPEGGPSVSSSSHSQPNNPFFPSTPGGASGNSSTQGSFGLGFGAGIGSGIGSSPGTVLSSVMQSRAANRPLSSASFYSTPPPAVGTASAHTPSGQAPPFHLPELSGMASGNSMLGLGRMQLGSMYPSRAGTPSRTVPSTPRGFESPVLANSRRQSFSDSAGDDMNATKVSLPSVGKSNQEYLHQHHQRPLDYHDSAYTSPVEALSFDALRQPKSTTSSQMNRHLPASRGQRSATRDKRVPQGYRRGSGGRRRRRASSPPRPAPPKRHENDIQLLMDVNYQGQMGFTVETELLLNYPTFAFLALPVKLVITGFSFRGKKKNTLFSLWAFTSIFMAFKMLTIDVLDSLLISKSSDGLFTRSC